MLDLATNWHNLQWHPQVETRKGWKHDPVLPLLKPVAKPVGPLEYHVHFIEIHTASTTFFTGLLWPPL